MSNNGEQHRRHKLKANVKLRYLLTALVIATVGTCTIHQQRLRLGIFPGFSLPSWSNTTPLPPCESPSLPKGHVHIILGGYKRSEPGLEMTSIHPEDNYLWDLELTNADIFWYRRVEPTQPLQPPIHGKCGMTIHERLLLPNHGRESAAFYDYVLEHYHNPPKMLVFLHGHGANAWHTSCHAVMARTAYYYRSLANPTWRAHYYKNVPNNHKNDRLYHDLDRNKTVAHHMMTLTSPWTTQNYNHTWFGFHQRRRKERRLGVSVPQCKLFQGTPWEQYLQQERPDPAAFQSCCASFILPGERLQRYPYEFWQYLRDHMLDPSTDDGETGRDCWEFIIWKLVGDTHDEYNSSQDVIFHQEADALVHGQRRSSNSLGADPAILNRLNRCEKAKLVSFAGEIHGFVQRRMSG